MIKDFNSSLLLTIFVNYFEKFKHFYEAGIGRRFRQLRDGVWRAQAGFSSKKTEI
jgi:hypothetical protein